MDDGKTDLRTHGAGIEGHVGAVASGATRDAGTHAASGAVGVLESMLGMPAGEGHLFVLPEEIERSAAVAALREALHALHERDRARERRGRLPANVGKPWSAAHDAQLLAAFDAGVPIDDIAVQLQRTRVGIRTRLERYGRLAPVAPAQPD